MNQVVVAVRPIQPASVAQLIVTDNDGLKSINLVPGALFQIRPNMLTRYCAGWYDILTHTSHPCPNTVTVNKKYTSCYACRQKTDFNPAFYNASSVSDKQNTYNNTPHFVYIAYFDSGIAKVGIAASSRGKLRLYEQGALLYTILQEFPDAYAARKEEARLIRGGFKETVSKKQKQAVFQALEKGSTLAQDFTTLLNQKNIQNYSIEDNLPMFFCGNPVSEPIMPLENDQPISGRIRGVVGHYLVFENTGRLYGVWLSSFLGYPITTSNTIIPITAEPLQIKLF